MYQNSRYPTGNPQDLPQKPHSVGPIPINYLPTQQVNSHGSPRGMPPQPSQFRSDQINYNKAPSPLNVNYLPHQYHAVNHVVTLPPSSPQARSSITGFKQSTNFDNRLSNQSNIRGRVSTQIPIRQNYHMGAIRQQNQHTHHQQARSTSPIQAQGATRQSRRLSPAFQGSAQKPTVIHFSYNQQQQWNVTTVQSQQNWSIQQRRRWQQWQRLQMEQHRLQQMKQQLQQTTAVPQQVPVPVSIPAPGQQTVQHQHIVTTTTTHHIIWQHRFVQIYMKFQSFVQAFQYIIEQLFQIQQLFRNVNDQEAWAQLRDRYTGLLDKFSAVREQIIVVLQNNHKVVDSLSPQTIQHFRLQEQNQQGQQGGQQNEQEQQQPRGPQNEQIRQQEQEEAGQTSKLVWEQRYYQVLEQYDNLSKQFNIIKAELQQLQSNPNDQPRQSQTAKVAELQQNLSQIYGQYQQLQAAYNQVMEQYKHVTDQLEHIQQFQQEREQFEQRREEFQEQRRQFEHRQQFQNIQQQNANNIQQTQVQQTHLKQMQAQLHEAHQRIQYLETQLTQNLQHRTQQQHNTHYENRIEELLEQKNHLIGNINQMHAELQRYSDFQKQRNQQFEEFQMKCKQQNEQLLKKVQKLQSQLELAHETNMNRQDENISVAKDVQDMRIRIQRYKHQLQQRDNAIFGIENDVNMAKDQCEQWKRRYNKLKKELQNLKNTQIQSYSSTNINTTTTSSNVDVYQFQKINREYNILIQQKSQLEQELSSFKLSTSTQIDDALQDKNRKLRNLQKQLDELQEQTRRQVADKEKSIVKIKQYFFEEQRLLQTKLAEKQNNSKLAQDKIKALESELADRNMQISKFRVQVNYNEQKKNISLSAGNSELVEKKNIQIQQLKRIVEQRNMQIKDHQRKIQNLQSTINQKIFQINNYKRQVYELHDLKAQIQKLNGTIKRKNQQVSQLRLSGLQADQMKLAMDSLQREKIRLNEHLKQKIRQIQSKDITIENLEKKLNNMSLQYGMNYGSKNMKDSLQLGPSQSVITNYQNLLKQKQSQLKKAQYQLEVAEVSASTKQKNIRDLNSKLSSTQRSYSMLRADQQNKNKRYENQIRALNKQVKNLKDLKIELQNNNESMKIKILSLQKSVEDGMGIYDRQIQAFKQKWITSQQSNTQLTIDQQLARNQAKRLQKQNKNLASKVASLQQRLDSKTHQNEELRNLLTKRGQQESNSYQQKIRILDEQLKISSVKVKQLQDQINNLNKKIKEIEFEKRSYRQKLYTEHSNNENQMRLITEYNNTENIRNSDYRQSMQRFMLKDPQANQVFERKVIYDLKRENEMLRRQITGLGTSSYSMVNRLETQHIDTFSEREQKQQRVPSVQEQQFALLQNNQMIAYHKNLNKDLQHRNDELLAFNKQLKDKLATFSGTKDASSQFYKSQITTLENQIKMLNNKIQQIIKQHSGARDNTQELQSENRHLKQENRNLQDQIIELKSKIKMSQNKIGQLQANFSVVSQENERLQEMLSKQRKQTEKGSSQNTKRMKDLQIQLTKANNKIAIQKSEIQRLTEFLNDKQEELSSKFGSSQQQISKLKQLIRQLENRIRELESLQQMIDRDLAYKLQRMRSGYIQMQTLLGQFELRSQRQKNAAARVRSGIGQNLKVLQTVVVPNI